jgi:hypothetical protein
MDYALPGHAVSAKKLMYMRMPTLERDFPEVALESRTFPIQYMTTEERVLEIDMALPVGYKTKWIPDPITIANPYIAYAAEYNEENGHVVFKETFQRLQRIVPAKDYAEYREALRRIAEFSKKEIFVTEKG